MKYQKENKLKKGVCSARIVRRQGDNRTGALSFEYLTFFSKKLMSRLLISDVLCQFAKISSPVYYVGLVYQIGIT